MPTPTLAPPYTARELPPEEWDRLADLPLGQALPDPANAALLVVEHAGQIVAAWAALTTVHLEGLYVVPEARKHPAVARTLVQGMSALLEARGIPQVVTVTQTPEIAALVEHIGGTPLGDLWTIPVPFQGGR